MVLSDIGIDGVLGTQRSRKSSNIGPGVGSDSSSCDSRWSMRLMLRGYKDDSSEVEIPRNKGCPNPSVCLTIFTTAAVAQCGRCRFRSDQLGRGSLGRRQGSWLFRSSMPDQWRKHNLGVGKPGHCGMLRQ